MGAVANAHPAAQCQQVMDARAKGAKRQKCQPFFINRDLSLRHGSRRHDPELTENMGCRHPPESFNQAMNNDRHAKPLQEQGQQWGQVGFLA